MVIKMFTKKFKLIHKAYVNICININLKYLLYKIIIFMVIENFKKKIFTKKIELRIKNISYYYDFFK